MQCRRCGMENMPGLSNCMRCNSALTAPATGPTYPPRAGWTLCLRPLFYRLNRFTAHSLLRWTKPEKPLSALAEALYGTPNLLWMVLSVVPGLGHLASGRLRRVRWFLPGWFLSLALGILSLGSGWAGMLIGLAIGLHTWVILDAGRVNGLFEKVRSQVLVSLLLYVLLAWGVYSQPRQYVDTVVLNADIPSHRIEANDLLIIRKGLDPATLRRGDLVIYRVAGAYGGQGQGHYAVQGGDVPGRVLAFGGETATSSHQGLLTIVGPDGATHTFESPVPVTSDFSSLQVPEDHVLCYPVAGLRGGGAILTADEVVRMTSLPLAKNVFARVVMKSGGFLRLERVPFLPLELKEAETP